MFLQVVCIMYSLKGRGCQFDTRLPIKDIANSPPQPQLHDLDERVLQLITLYSEILGSMYVTTNGQRVRYINEI